MTDFEKIIIAALEDQGGAVSGRQFGSPLALPSEHLFRVFWPKFDQTFMIEFDGNEARFYSYIARKGYHQFYVYSEDLLDPSWSPLILAQKFIGIINN